MTSAARTQAGGSQLSSKASVSANDSAVVSAQLLWVDPPVSGGAFGIMAGVQHVFDTSFSRTFSLLESQREFVERFQRREQEKKSLPMMTSACPGDPTTLVLQENVKKSRVNYEVNTEM